MEAIQKIQKNGEVTQIQYIDKVADISVAKKVQVPAIHEVQNVVEVPQVQLNDDFDDTVEMPVMKTVEANNPKGPEECREEADPVH